MNKMKLLKITLVIFVLGMLAVPMLGCGSESDEAEQISNGIREQFPQLQVEVIRGGQPHYGYIISVE